MAGEDDEEDLLVPTPHEHVPGKRGHAEGWLILSPRAKQMVVHTGHAVEDADPELVIDVILGVVRAARN